MTDDRYGDGYVNDRQWADLQPQNSQLNDEQRERWRSDFCRAGGKIASRRSRVV